MLGKKIFIAPEPAFFIDPETGEVNDNNEGVLIQCKSVKTKGQEADDIYTIADVIEAIVSYETGEYNNIYVLSYRHSIYLNDPDTHLIFRYAVY